MIRLIVILFLSTNFSFASGQNKPFTPHLNCLKGIQTLLFQIPLHQDQLFLPLNGESLLVMTEDGIYKADFSSLERQGFGGINTHYVANISIPRSARSQIIRLSDTYEGSREYRYRVHIENSNETFPELRATEHTSEDSKRRITNYIYRTLQQIDQQYDTQALRRITNTQIFNLKACLEIKDISIQHLAQRFMEKSESSSTKSILFEPLLISN